MTDPDPIAYNVVHLNCCHIRKLYDESSQTINPNFDLLLQLTTPTILLLTETKLADIEVARRIKTVCGFDKGRMEFLPGSSHGTPHGLMAFWKSPLKANEIQRGTDWFLLDFGMGFKLAYVYSAPGDRGQHFLERIAAWASCSRLLLIGDMNPTSNARATRPVLLGAGLARVPCPATTRGTRPGREPTDEVWCSAQYARMLVAGVTDRPYFECLSDYHWPVVIRIPKTGFLHAQPQAATWGSRMVRVIRNQFRPSEMTLISLIRCIRESHPPAPWTGVHHNIGSMPKLFFTSPSKYADVLFGHEAHLPASGLSRRDQEDIAGRTNARFAFNPPKSGEAALEFIRVHVDPHYDANAGEGRGCDRELMALVQVEEVHATLAALRDAATQDFGVEAMVEILRDYGHDVARIFTVWIEAGRCLEPLVLALAYQIISKKGQISPSQHRLVVIEMAFGRLWYKLLERRLRRALDAHNVLASNNVAFCSDRSAVEVLVTIKTLVDSGRAQAPCYVATADWPSAYDYMNWTLLPAIGERIMGAGRFFTLLVRCFRDAPRILHMGPNAAIGPLQQAFNGGPQGNCVLPLAWNVYVDPLARALKRQNPRDLPASATVFCDDSSAYRRNLDDVRRFFDTVDEYVIATGSPLGTKNAIAANAAGIYAARVLPYPHGFTHLAKQHGAPVLIEGSIGFLGACLHLDPVARCATRACKYCNVPSPCKVCESCIGTFTTNVKHSALSPLNRANLITYFVYGPLLQQIWLCPNAKQRFLAWNTGPGRSTGIRAALHNNPIGGPWNESLEMDVHHGGAGLGNMAMTLAKSVISDFTRCAYGPSDHARALTDMWHRRGNKVVHEALREIRGQLTLRSYPQQSYLDKWRCAHLAPHRLQEMDVLYTWTRRWANPTDSLWIVAVAKRGTDPETIGEPLTVRLVCVRELAEAELAAIWAAVSLGFDCDTYVIATTPQAVARVNRYREEAPRKRRKLAYGLFLESIAQNHKNIVSAEACGASLEWLANLPIDGSMVPLHLQLPPPIVKLTLPHVGTRYDRLHSALNAACKEMARRATWEKMQASLGDPSFRVPAPGGDINDLGWAQSARVTITSQTKLACRSPVGPGDVTHILNLRFAGYLKRAIMPTTQCAICGGGQYTLTHLLALAHYTRAVDHVTEVYENFMIQHEIPAWWRNWDRADAPLLTALGWVPIAVEQKLARLHRNDKTTHSHVAKQVLDVQLHLVRALLSVYTEHYPSDARPRHLRGHDPDTDADPLRPAPAADDEAGSPFIARALPRAQGRPTLAMMRENYRINEKVLVMFDGAARKTCSGSAVVIVTPDGNVYRVGYRHPVYRNATKGERIGFVLAILAYGNLRHALRGTAQDIREYDVAWIGDNETLMLQIRQAGTTAYRSTEDLTRHATAWIRARIHAHDRVLHVQREYNWHSDAAANAALDAWIRARARPPQGSFELGNTHDLIAATEAAWSIIEAADGHVYDALVEDERERESSEGEHPQSSSEEEFNDSDLI